MGAMNGDSTSGTSIRGMKSDLISYDGFNFTRNLKDQGSRFAVLQEEEEEQEQKLMPT